MIKKLIHNVPIKKALCADGITNVTHMKLPQIDKRNIIVIQKIAEYLEDLIDHLKEPEGLPSRVVRAPSHETHPSDYRRIQYTSP